MEGNAKYLLGISACSALHNRVLKGAQGGDYETHLWRVVGSGRRLFIMHALCNNDSQSVRLAECFLLGIMCLTAVLNDFNVHACLFVSHNNI
eukprot:scaffold14967_cov17-Prasinocladus_malaysianus.AAC.1